MIALQSAYVCVGRYIITAPFKAKLIWKQMANAASHVIAEIVDNAQCLIAALWDSERVGSAINQTK